jgi:hypothetical protein
LAHETFPFSLVPAVILRRGRSPDLFARRNKDPVAHHRKIDQAHMNVPAYAGSQEEEATMKGVVS